jgi:hypothetical protein
MSSRGRRVTRSKTSKPMLPSRWRGRHYRSVWIPCQDVAVGRYRAVLFDWRGVLALDPEPAWCVERALQSIGRPVESEFVEAA